MAIPDKVEDTYSLCVISKSSLLVLPMPSIADIEGKACRGSLIPLTRDADKGMKEQSSDGSFTLPSRYRYSGLIGHGAYGLVWYHLDSVIVFQLSLGHDQRCNRRRETHQPNRLDSCRQAHLTRAQTASTLHGPPKCMLNRLLTLALDNPAPRRLGQRLVHLQGPL
jgi:hypothetical protein